MEIFSIRYCQVLKYTKMRSIKEITSRVETFRVDCGPIWLHIVISHSLITQALASIKYHPQSSVDILPAVRPPWCVRNRPKSLSLRPTPRFCRNLKGNKTRLTISSRWAWTGSRRLTRRVGVADGVDLAIRGRANDLDESRFANAVVVQFRGQVLGQGQRQRHHHFLQVAAQFADQSLL